MATTATAPKQVASPAPTSPIDESKLRGITTDVLNRWPSAGVAVSVVHDGEWRGSTDAA
jgi:hypothetical protein